jgi:phytoene desaturase
VLLPVTHDTGSVDWPREQQRFRALAFEQMKKIGITDVEKRIRTEAMLTPQDWNREYGLYRGATFAMAHSLRQMLHMRPHNRFEDLESVYLVGGGTHPGSGLPVIFESARITSRLLLEDFNVAPRWNTDPITPEVPMKESLCEAVSSAR